MKSISKVKGERRKQWTFKEGFYYVDGYMITRSINLDTKAQLSVDWTTAADEAGRSTRIAINLCRGRVITRCNKKITQD